MTSPGVEPQSWSDVLIRNIYFKWPNLNIKFYLLKGWSIKHNNNQKFWSWVSCIYWIIHGISYGHTQS